LPWSSDNRPIIVPPSTESLGKRNHDLRNRSTGVYQQYPSALSSVETNTPAQVLLLQEFAFLTGDRKGPVIPADAPIGLFARRILVAHTGLGVNGCRSRTEAQQESYEPNKT